MTKLQKAYTLIDQVEHDFSKINNPYKGRFDYEAKRFDLELAKISKMLKENKKMLHDLVLQETSKK